MSLFNKVTKSFQWGDKTVVLWLRGRYKSMNDYSLDVVGMFDPGPN